VVGAAGEQEGVVNLAPVMLDLAMSPPAGDAWLLPARSPEAPVLLIVPALGVAARSYRRFAEALQARGISAACAEMRGVGSSPLRARRGVDWGYLDLVDDELRALHAAVTAQLPRAPKVIAGHSLGGQLALLHQARHPQQRAEAVVLLSSGSPWHRAYPLHTRLLVRSLGALAGAMANRLGVFRGELIRFGGPQGAQLMREWSGFVRTGQLGVLAGWDADAALAELDMPLHAVLMRGDYYAPRSSTEHLAAKTASTLEVSHIDTVDGHAPGHFRWMRHPGMVAERLAEVLRATQRATAITQRCG
jgi:predicted alpha/beta hydrolase